MDKFKKLLEECKDFLRDDPIYCGLELSTKEVAIVVEALEKQVPKKPIDIYNRSALISIYCPKCERGLDGEYRNRYDYCPDCGQRINWR